MTQVSAGAAGALRLQGDVTLASVTSLLPAGRQRAHEAAFIVDLAEVGAVDSAVLALLFDWQRHARVQGHTMRVRNVPPQLRSLAALYGVGELLEEMAA